MRPDDRLIDTTQTERERSRNIIRSPEVRDLVDGSDNFPTRYLVNDAAVLVGKPVVHGSIFQFEGQVSVFQPHAGPCYRCLYPTPAGHGAVVQ